MQRITHKEIHQNISIQLVIGILKFYINICIYVAVTARLTTLSIYTTLSP